MNRLVPILVFGFAGACASVKPTPTRSAEASFRELGLPRAAFELSCPAEQVSLTILRDSDPNPYSRGMAGAQVGATGCGKKAVYVFHDSAGWVINSVGDKPIAAQ